jgi:hypothetical protein
MMVSSSNLALPPCLSVGWRSINGPGPSTPLDDYVTSIDTGCPDRYPSVSDFLHPLPIGLRWGVDGSVDAIREKLGRTAVGYAAALFPKRTGFPKSVVHWPSGKMWLASRMEAVDITASSITVNSTI